LKVASGSRSPTLIVIGFVPPQPDLSTDPGGPGAGDHWHGRHGRATGSRLGTQPSGRPLSGASAKSGQHLGRQRCRGDARAIVLAISGALRPSAACRTICARRTKPAPHVRERATGVS
jgi:hypothetical protein